MLTLGISTYVALVRDSYTQGGLAAGCYALGAAVGGPLAGVCADRFGQRWVCYVLIIANSASISAVFFTATGGLPLLLMFSAFAGFTIVPAGPFSRIRWSAIIDAHVPRADRKRVTGAAFGYETLADELTFVFGPVIVGLIARGSAGAPLVACVAIVLVFGFLFGQHRTARAVPRKTGDTAAVTPVRTLVRADRVTLVVTMISIGTLFGAQVNSVVAFAGEHGAISNAGLIYAGFGIGSGAASIAVGLIRLPLNLHQRWLASAAIAVAAATAATFVDSPLLLAATLTLLGIGIGPVIVAVYELAAVHMPIGRESFYMTVLASALVGGNAIGAALAGSVVEQHGSTWGFWSIAALSTWLFALGIVSCGSGRRTVTPERVEDAE